MVIKVERFPLTTEKLTVRFTEHGLATVVKLGAMGFNEFPSAHHWNKSTGVTLSVDHGSPAVRLAVRLSAP